MPVINCCFLEDTLQIAENLLKDAKMPLTIVERQMDYDSLVSEVC